MRCSNSMPAIVIAAFLNPLKPSITAMRCLTPRWSCSIRLFRYFDKRSLVSAGQAIGFQLTHGTVGCGVAVQRDRLRAAPLALDRFSKERLGSCDIARGAQPDVDRPACPVNGTIQVAPFASDLDVGLVDPP